MQIIYSQMKGSKKPQNQDALYNGLEVVQASFIKAAHIDVGRKNYPIKLAVSDGIASSPQPHLASKFCMQQYALNGDKQGGWLRSFQEKLTQYLAKKYLGSATTFAAAYIEQDGRCFISNVGDSRIYHIQQSGEWVQKSHDHTELNDLIELGQADADVEYASIYNILTEYLVADAQEYEFKIFNCNFQLQFGDIVLLCSDGLTDALEKKEMEFIWQQHDTILNKLEALRTKVAMKKRHDDFSVVIYQH